MSEEKKGDGKLTKGFHAQEKIAEGLELDAKNEKIKKETVVYWAPAKGYQIASWKPERMPVTTSHAGLINTVEQIKTVTGETSIYAIIGGLHLKAAKEPRIEATLDALKQWNPDYLIPCHCTGFPV